jgi:hypothetical protein
VFGIRRGKHAAERASLGDTQQHRALGSCRLHHRPHIIEALLEGGELVDGNGVGQTSAALVEEDQACHPRQAREETGERRLVPEIFQVRHPAHHEHEIDRT